MAFLRKYSELYRQGPNPLGARMVTNAVAQARTCRPSNLIAQILSGLTQIGIGNLTTVRQRPLARSHSLQAPNRVTCVVTELGIAVKQRNCREVGLHEYSIRREMLRETGTQEAAHLPSYSELAASPVAALHPIIRNRRQYQPGCQLTIEKLHNLRHLAVVTCI